MLHSLISTDMRGFIGMLPTLLSACATQNIENISIRGGSTTQQHELAEAVHAVEKVWENDAFWELVRGRRWRLQPGKPVIDGTDVADLLRKHAPAKQRYQIVLFYGWHVWNIVYSTANGQSSQNSAISLVRHKFGEISLINTVAHENSHVASGEVLDGEYAETDLPWLVSYGIGDLAECFSASGGDAVRTEACFAAIVNSKPACRPYLRDCAGEVVKTPACTAIKHDCAWHGH